MPPVLLVLRALKLGDLLVAVPALRALRRAFPGHRLVLATTGWLAPVVALTGVVDELVPSTGLAGLAGLSGPVDIAVNMHGAGPQSTAALDALAPRRRIGHRGHGWDGPGWVEELPERARWCRLLREHGIPADPDDLLLGEPPVPSPAPGAVVVHPGAAYGSKRWPPERFGAVAAALVADGHPVVVSGGAGERELTGTVRAGAGLAPDADLGGDTGLAQLCALVAGAALVVCGDTGIAHVASAYRTPSVVLFGPVPARRWGPPDGPHRVLSADADRRGEPFAGDPDPALLGVGVPDVLAAARGLLDQSKNRAQCDGSSS